METLQQRIEDCWDEPAATEDHFDADLKALQGSWFSSSGRREAQFLVSGTHFTVRFADGDIYMGVFDLNLATQPKTMVMHVEAGPAAHKGKVALCLYEVNGSSLRWCTPNPGRQERLTAFPAEDHPWYLSLLFQRAQAV